MEETKPQLGIFHHQVKPTIPGIGCISSVCWPKRLQVKPERTQAIIKVIHCSIQTDGKTLLLKKTPKSVIEHRETEIMPNIRLHLSICVHETGRYSTQYQRRKVTTNTSTNPVIYNDDIPALYAVAIVSVKLVEAQPLIDCIQDLL